MTPEHLENRLIDFATKIIDLIETLPESKASNHIAGQLLRSGTSPAPNYAEARSAESRKDFIHKMKIALKELRETLVWLKIIQTRKTGGNQAIRHIIRECSELVAIFVSSTKTADSTTSKIKNPQSSIIIPPAGPTETQGHQLTSEDS